MVPHSRRLPLSSRSREGRHPSNPPLLWIEILSPDDSMADVWQRANELVALGVPYVWIIEPNARDSELRSAGATVHLADKVLRLPEYGIEIPLLDVMQGRTRAERLSDSSRT